MTQQSHALGRRDPRAQQRQHVAQDHTLCGGALANKGGAEEKGGREGAAGEKMQVIRPSRVFRLRNMGKRASFLLSARRPRAGDESGAGFAAGAGDNRR